MVRRHIVVTALALAALAAGACSNPTAPKCDQVTIGSGNEQVTIGSGNEQVTIGSGNLSCSR